MTNELTTSQGQALQSISGQQTPAAVVQIADWAAELDAAHRLGSALAQSRFLPEGMLKLNKSEWKTQEQVAADAAITILAGKSLGLDPLASVQNIFTVRGRPGMYARTMVGIAMSHGHEIERSEATSQSVTIRARRKGSREWHTFTWDMARAKQAGYDSNPIYRADPIAMLTAKAQAEACRTLFADVLMGMPYSSEDLQLEDLGEVEDAPKTTVKRKPRAKTKTQSTKPVPEPAQEQEEPQDQGDDGDAPEPAEDDEPDAAEQPEPISQQTWNEIKELLKEKAPGESPGPWGMKTIGRTVKKWADFTQTEGDQMLELLVNGEVTDQAEAS